MDIAAITSLEEKIIKSEENSNGIVDLLHCIEVKLSCSRVGKEVLALCPCMQAPNEEVVSAAVSAVGRVFSSLLERHYSWFSSVERKAVGGNEVALRYQKWMKKKYQMALQMLVQLLARPSLQVTVTQLSHDLMMTSKLAVPVLSQEHALSVLLQWVKAEGCSQLQSTGGRYRFPNHTFSTIAR